MSKKYDEEYERITGELGKIYPVVDGVIPMIPKQILYPESLDYKLVNEVFDKQVISYTKSLLNSELYAVYKDMLTKEAIISTIYKEIKDSYGNILPKEINPQTMERGITIMTLIEQSITRGKDLSYGDIRLIIDGYKGEKEYEEQNKRTYSKQ